MYSVRRTILLALAVVVTAFVALYPQLEAVGMCDSGECPPMTGSTSVGYSVTCCAVVASLAVVPAASVAAFGLRLRVTRAWYSPSQVHLSPESPPPQLSL